MESIEKLRKMDDEMLVPLGNGQYVPDHSHNDIADQIEAEIADNYMKLPLDADRVQIHVGDELQDEETGEKYQVLAICCNQLISNEAVGTPLGNCFRSAMFSRHVKQRTIEDVLEDFGIECDEQYPIRPRAELIAEYADEIRELLGVS